MLTPIALAVRRAQVVVGVRSAASEWHDMVDLQVGARQDRLSAQVADHSVQYDNDCIVNRLDLAAVQIAVQPILQINLAPTRRAGPPISPALNIGFPVPAADY